ncbi:MAG: hypothetical protein SOR57_11725 [Parabacteroides sp.]|nr:hypothetical protein [Parabacteroides sp.]
MAHKDGSLKVSKRGSLKTALQRQLASFLEIDTPMFSKIERGDRRAKHTQVYLSLSYKSYKELQEIKSLLHSAGLKADRFKIQTVLAF